MTQYIYDPSSDVEYPSIYVEYTNDEIRTPHAFHSGSHNLDGAKLGCEMWGRKGNKYTVYIVVRKWNKSRTNYRVSVKVWARGLHNASGIEWREYK